MGGERHSVEEGVMGSRIFNYFLLALLCCFASMAALADEQTKTAPEILDITFPETIQADDQVTKGRILFKDADGDAERVEFQIIEAEAPQAITIDGKSPEENLVSSPIRSPAQKQVAGKGTILVRIAVTTPQVVRIQVTLVDAAGNASEPGELVFRARGHLPDLAVSLTDVPTEAYIGQGIEVCYTVGNIGGSSSGAFRVGLYLSDDAAITTEDPLLGSHEIPKLLSDSSSAEQLSITLSQDFLSEEGFHLGPLFLGVIVDDLGLVEESDEGNNVASTAIQVELPPTQPAFFELLDLSVEPSNPVSGSTVDIEIIIENTGEEAGERMLELYVDGVRQEGRTVVLDPGQKMTVSFGHIFPWDEAAHEVVIRAETYDGKRTQCVMLREPPHTVGPSGCPFTRIQTAIDAANTGDTITVAPGTYSETLRIDKSITLDGAGKATISGDGNNPTISVSNAETVTIQGFTITSRPLSNSGNSGVCITDSSQVTLERNTIAGNGECGIWIWGDADVAIRNNAIEDNGDHGVRISGVSNVSLEDSRITHNGRFGISVWGNATVEIRNTVVSDNDDDGVYIGNDAEVFIDHASITGNGFYGIGIVGNAKAKVQNTVISNSEDTGLYITTDSTVTLENNTIRGNDWHGISIRGTAVVEIRGNLIDENRRNGVTITESAKATIEGNTIISNGYCGIYAESSSRNLTSCSGNTVSGNKVDNYCRAAP